MLKASTMTHNNEVASPSTHTLANYDLKTDLRWNLTTCCIRNLHVHVAGGLQLLNESTKLNLKS